jgi:O-antigen/teichoic acid export membrane protein
LNDFFDDKTEKKHKTDSNNTRKGVSSQFTSSSILLFVNQLIVAFGNWIFWMAISKLASTEEIGQSTTIYSLVVFFTTIIQFGLEYPILKYSYKYRKSILSSALIIEIGLSILSIPFLILTFDNFYDKGLVQFELLSITMILLTIPGFVAHFVLLGLFRVRAVLIIDILATIAKFVVGFILVSMGMGSMGILIAFIFHISIMSFFSFYIVRHDFTFKLDLKMIKVFLREGMVNTPSRISRIFIFSLSVVLLAIFGIDTSQIGIFYIAITISLVAGGFATNIALMVIPASTKSNENIAPTGLRIGLSFTTPFIILLMTHSTTILGLIGHNYMGAGLELAILGLSILPASITIIAISEFNNTHQLRKILIIGITEIITFLISFSLIVPNTGILGAALATLIAFLISSILAVLWINRISIKYIINSIVSIVSGLILWIVLVLTLGDSETLNAITIVPILIVSTTIIFYLNKITLSEIKGMMHALYRKGELS